jgi:cell division transport system permease protein
MKLIFIIMRGIKLFLTYFKANILSFFALSALFLILHVAFGFGTGLATFASNVAKFDTVRVYLSSADDEVVSAVDAALTELPEAVSTDYNSSKQVKEYIATGASTLEGVEDLPDELFPSYIELKVRSEYNTIEQLDQLVAKISDIDGVEQASYGQDWARQLSQGRNAVVTMLTLASILFALVGAVLIYQTVSITLYRYWQEVRIYSVVGGTSAFIALPFMVTASCTGLMCSIASLVAYIVLYALVLTPIEATLGLAMSVNVLYGLAFTLGVFVISTLAGLFSAGRFLRMARAQ